MVADRVKVREDVLRNPKHVLVTIQVLMVQGKSIFVAYKDFCKILGDDVMEYNDFDFWWFRFLNGEFDLDYDRSKEKKKRELGDMPPLIVEKIIKNLDCEDRYPLLEVSKGIRNIMEDSDLLISKLAIRFMHNKISLQFNGRYAVFVKGRETRIISGSVEKFFEEGHDDIALKNLALILNNPKLRFVNFFVGFIKSESAKHDELMKCSKAVKKVLKSTPHQIHVDTLEIHVVEDTQLMDIVPYLKPGVLRMIGINSGETIVSDIKGLVELEQFKQAQAFWMRNLIFYAPFEKLAHLRCFSIHLSIISEEEFIRMKDILLASPQFDHCYLNQKNLENRNLWEKFNEKVFPIPGSTDSLQILFEYFIRSHEIIIRRISNK